MNGKSVLSIKDYSVMCSLGCLPEERAKLQEVRISLKIEFKTRPKACLSDELEDTLCYALLCKQIKAVADKKAFKTVEHLCHEIELQLQSSIKDNSWHLAIHKVQPPIEGLKSGVRFEVGNLW